MNVWNYLESVSQESAGEATEKILEETNQNKEKVLKRQKKTQQQTMI